MNHQTPLVMLVAGEASGDRYAADIFLELKQLLPDIRAIGMGGHHMVEAGVDVRYDSTNIAVIGIGEILKHYGEIKRALKLVQRIACEEQPDLLICVDYKEFNFKLARKAKACGIKVLFYVSPQVWAWRPGRVKKYGEVVDMMAVIFPFEESYYQKYGIPVRYVGHPLVDRVHPSLTRKTAFEQFGLDPSIPVVGLFPGSRGNEIKRLLPVMLDAAKLLRRRSERVQFILSQAPSLSDESTDNWMISKGIPMPAVKGQTYDVMQCCDAIMIASGTATLEAALLGIPMTITYKVTSLTYIIGKLLINIPFIGLPNILAGKQVVKEFIQYDAQPKKLALEIERILLDTAYAESMRGELQSVKQQLGKDGGIKNIAALAAEMFIN